MLPISEALLRAFSSARSTTRQPWRRRRTTPLPIDAEDRGCDFDGFTDLGCAFRLGEGTKAHQTEAAIGFHTR
jgi:hypothetical protein